MITTKEESHEITVENGELMAVELPTDLMQKASMAVKSLATMKPMISIKLEYKYFKENEVCRGVFLGFTKMPKDGELLDSVMWMEQNGITFYNSAKILVGDCQKYKMKIGTPIEISFLGEKKTKANRKAHVFKVMILGESNEHS